MINDMKYKHTVAERFLRYVQIDTQSDPQSDTFPTTEKQKNLSRILVDELKAMGITNAHMDEFGYVYASIASNTTKSVPAIAFCAHVDTSPDCSGKDVKPIMHKNYQGQDLVLPDDTTQVIRCADYPYLNQLLGHDIITASGLTLLGSDDKAGVAEIMDAANYLMCHPEVKHGQVALVFTPDEEVGKGTAKIDLEKIGARYGYTLDGGEAGVLEDETFSADAVTISIHGIIAHPGYAKGKLVNALKIAGELLAMLPKDILSPETTSGREGFIHPGSGFSFSITEQYRNMKDVLDKEPHVVQYAEEAITRVGLVCRREHIRGGTDGSKLSFMGLPCPNIFAGEQAIHSKHEFISVQDMNKAVDTIIELVKIWEERGGTKI
jgi:tripeptide aminopeptidase